MRVLRGKSLFKIGVMELLPIIRLYTSKQIKAFFCFPVLIKPPFRMKKQQFPSRSLLLFLRLYTCSTTSDSLCRMVLIGSGNLVNPLTDCTCSSACNLPSVKPSVHSLNISRAFPEIPQKLKRRTKKRSAAHGNISLPSANRCRFPLSGVPDILKPDNSL